MYLPQVSDRDEQSYNDGNIQYRIQSILDRSYSNNIKNLFLYRNYNTVVVR